MERRFTTNPPDGTVVAMVDGRTIRFKSIADLELMLEAKGATQLGASS
jgi:hypothetical protein